MYKRQGRLDAATGQVESADLSDPQVDDLLDDLGDLVEKMGGRVVVMPTAQMPSQTGLAATYRSLLNSNPYMIEEPNL